MSLSDSDDDLIPRSKQQRAAAASSASLSDSDDDAFADVFRPKPKTTQRNQAAEADSYNAPPRSHICDECEGNFSEAVFCGECSMTYCLGCDQRYHSGSEDVRVHYRSALHGSVPQAIAGQVAAEQAEEEREAARQRQRDEENLQRQADERAARRRLHDSAGGTGFSDDDEQDRVAAAARDARPKDQWQQVGSQAANEARRMFYPSAQSNSAPRGSMPPPAGPLSPSAASAAAWRPQSPLAARSAASLAAAAYPVPAAQSRNATGVSFALDPFGSTGPPLQGQRNQSAASRSSRPSSAGSRPMVVLQSTRPASASASAAAARGRVVSNPTRVGVTSSDPSLSGKTRFNRNMTIRSTSGSAAAIHQRLPPRDGGFAARKANTGQGAHSNPSVHRWSSESADRDTMVLHSSMLALKAELSALQEQKQLSKTAVLKRQKALKEIGRIAATLAKQPNVDPPREERSASGAFASTQVSTVGGGELGEKVAALRTSVEILRLEVEDLTAKLVATRAQGDARSHTARELQALERERSELARSVSIAAASRELDSFKRTQLLADLRYACTEMQGALDSKKRETTHAKMTAMQLENQNRNMQAEYERIQAQVDQWAAKQVS